MEIRGLLLMGGPANRFLSLLNLLAAGEVKTEETFAFQNSPELWVIFLVILPGAALFSFYIYRRESPELRLRMRIFLAALRTAIFLLLFLFLFRPVLLVQRVREVKPVSVLLLDNSASMREHDRYSEASIREDLARAAGLPDPEGLRGETRYSLVKKVLTHPLTSPIARLEDRYDLKYYAFDSTVTPAGGLDDLTFEGDSTRLGDALAEVVKQFRGQRLQNIILLSDGRSNRGRDPNDGALLAATEQIPVYTVGVGDPAVSKNIEIISVTAPDLVLVNDEVVFKVNITSRGYEGRPVLLQLKNSGDGDVLATGEALLKGDGLEQQDLLYWKPEREGAYYLEVTIPVEPDEQDAEDNTFKLLLRVESEHIKVLYVDGYPRWEYRALWTLLTRVENFEVQVLLQSADTDFVQESSPHTPPLRRFPKELKDLLNYHVILFGDVDPIRLGEDGEQSEHILKNIKAFVEAGGGFLMQAGSLFSPSAYIDTPIADILPVIPGNYAEQHMIAGSMGGAPFRVKLENALDPPEIMRLDKDPVKNRRLWEDPEYGLSAFYWYFPVERAKPGAAVLARHPINKNRYGRHILFASTYYPAGRTVFIGVDSTWRWHLPYRDFYTDLFWRKMVRYLAQSKLRRKDYRFDLNTDRSRYDLNERVRITARIRDVDFRLSEKPFQEIRIQDPRAKVEELDLNFVEPGSYDRIIVAQEAGTYQLWIEDEGETVGSKQALTSFTVTIPQLEAENPILDRPVLENVARISGGTYFGLHEFGKLVNAMKDEKSLRPLSDPERRDLWSSPWALLLFTLLIGTEWILRKRRNLL